MRSDTFGGTLVFFEKTLGELEFPATEGSGRITTFSERVAKLHERNGRTLVRLITYITCDELGEWVQEFLDEIQPRAADEEASGDEDGG